MNRILLGFAFVVAASGPVAAAGFRYLNQPSPGPRVVAGTVQLDGTVLAGQGFKVYHTGTGTYVIKFVNNSLRGCISMTVTSATSAPIGLEAIYAAVQKEGCGRTFTVTVSDSGVRPALQDVTFQFIAVEER